MSTEKFTYLNIEIEKEAMQHPLQAFASIYKIHKRKYIQKWVLGIIAFCIVVLFLPWTQNIRTKGKITTLRQEARPQQLNTILSGKIVKWFVKEGDMVKKGDTLLQLGEVKSEYFDPQLLNRTSEQIVAKKQSIDAYIEKAATTEKQAAALKEGLQLKLASYDNKIEQQQLKIVSDSMDVLAAVNDLNIYKRQIDAARVMLDSGVISLTDFEKRKANFQTAIAKKTSSENKFLQSKQELLNLRIEKNSTIQDYTDKISKAEGDKFSALSQAASTRAEVSKLENLYTNYDIRNQLYYITAPQSGQITKAKKAGIDEMVKEGDMIVEIVPDMSNYAVEMFVTPNDIPLVSKEQEVALIFDGFPAIVFSGWPQSSYGTFLGQVSAIENNINTTGNYRVLITPDSSYRPWPKQLKLGSGAKCIALLKNVPVYYELWRTINGFPPEYYSAESKPDNEKGK
ncbi:HlyD family efflux transporter periplasmic adaptor subunit [Hydrotalea sp.]|uniref:HlyD family secretion protein n=1 Tax=Hydrotalea sp. TaxID=2881279 RepID=UPI002628EEB8|nr:HlyD family efflux transporter periplasmic adaptor subunit [Hydrotalea sp.]